MWDNATWPATKSRKFRFGVWDDYENYENFIKNGNQSAQNHWGYDNLTDSKSEMKSEEEWKRELTPEQYNVCRLKGTEPPFTGKYNDAKDKGVYQCVACGNELFSSDTKFDSGTGWPSFSAPINENQVQSHKDNSHGMDRTEVLCSKCNSHLGHVFDDGPTPTNQRFCINSASLNLKKDKSEFDTSDSLEVKQ